MRYAGSRFAQSTGVWQLGKLRRADENDEEEEPQMERSRKKTSLGRVLGERLEQVFCHDSALALDITVKVYRDIEFWRSSEISKDYQVLLGQLMLPKGMVEVAASLRSLVKGGWLQKERR